MSALIELFEQRLQQGLQRYARDSAGMRLALPEFTSLSRCAEQLKHKFDQGKPATPPLQQRIQALALLRRQPSALSRREWCLISWGLSDECGTSGRSLDDAALYQQIHAYVAEQIQQHSLVRRMWFGLVYSYFAYPSDQPEQHPDWCRLRQQLLHGFEMLHAKEKRPRPWSVVMAKNLELFTDTAGAALGSALCTGDAAPLQELQAQLPIAEASWLWHRIVSAQLTQLRLLGDADFGAQVDKYLHMAQQYPRHADEILAATLARYAQSSFRDESHPGLKHLSLERWGSPQVRTSNPRWQVHVSDDVCKMVLRWFAKEDLEHFFKLLQGESGVDQERLNYWLRFVDQIGYTRVVMGSDAFNDQSLDFQDFRTKNKGRFSRLTGNQSHNNAFIMRIADYYFVEFSSTGNACYFYHSDKLPFNPDHAVLEPNHELKQVQLVQLRHSSKNKFNHMNGWQQKADAIFCELGIFAHSVVRAKPVPTVSSIPDSPSVALINGQPLAMPVDAGIARVLSYLATLPIPPKTDDLRSKGGAFWVFTDEHAPAALFLKRAGFRYASKRGYWRK